MVLFVLFFFIVWYFFMQMIGVWWGYPLGPNGKYSVRGERVYESKREGKREGTSAD